LLVLVFFNILVRVDTFIIIAEFYVDLKNFSE